MVRLSGRVRWLVAVAAVVGACGRTAKGPVVDIPVAAPVTAATEATTTTAPLTKYQWLGRYGRDMTDVADSLKVIRSSFATQDPHDVAISCHDLVRELQTVASHPAIPDEQAMALYKSALAIVAPTAAACQADATLPAASDRAKVEPEFEAYVGRLSAIQDALSAP